MMFLIVAVFIFISYFHFNFIFFGIIHHCAYNNIIYSTNFNYIIDIDINTVINAVINAIIISFAIDTETEVQLSNNYGLNGGCLLLLDKRLGKRKTGAARLVEVERFFGVTLNCFEPVVDEATSANCIAAKIDSFLRFLRGLFLSDCSETSSSISSILRSLCLYFFVLYILP